jgi:hypothetical protein
MHSKGKIKRRAFVICATLLILYFLPLAGLWPRQIWHGWCSVAIESECQDLDVANPSPSLAAVLPKLQKTPQLKLEKVGLLTHDMERHFTFTGKKDRTHQTIFLAAMRSATPRPGLRWSDGSYTLGHGKTCGRSQRRTSLTGGQSRG